MVRDADATRARLLASATTEFAEHGIAGARVDRIAARGKANKALIYTYFGNKEGLFTAVINAHLDEVLTTVRFDPRDLPGYAGRMFDFCREHPELNRLMVRLQLEPELEPATSAEVRESYRSKVAGVEQAQRDGLVEPSWNPLDLLALVNAIIGAWANHPLAVHPTESSGPETAAQIARHRAATVEAVRRLITPSGPTASG